MNRLLLYLIIMMALLDLNSLSDFNLFFPETYLPLIVSLLSALWRASLQDRAENLCSPDGLVILEIYDEDPICEEHDTKLAAIEGIEVQKMVFTH
jgi:hypothetical protein